MKLNLPFTVLASFAALLAMLSPATAPADFPADHRDIAEPVNFEELEALIESIADSPLATVEVVGESVEGRPLYLVTLRHPGAETTWSALYIGTQHGNEPAGKDAICYLMRGIADDPSLLPRHVELHLLPNINPDGTEANRRRNGNGADLNRDHIGMEQPETAVLHAVARRLRPDVSVDCHEFTRDSSSYTERGWGEWPLVMMDTAGTPFIDEDLYRAGLEWVESARPAMNAAGHNYTRYYVGGTPPEGEVRFSTMEADDARNGLALYGGLSFIIESGVMRSSPDPNADLGERIDAYLVLLRRFLVDTTLQDAHRPLIAASRARTAPRLVATNAFWGTTRLSTGRVIVTDLDTGEPVLVDAPRTMDERIIKSVATVPRAYVVDAAAAGTMAPFLDRHGIAYDRLDAPAQYIVESGTLDRIEDFADPVYNRFAGRQIVTLDAPSARTFDAGSLLVPARQPDWRVVTARLEPTMMYGIYQFETFRALVSADGTLPVHRLP